MKIYSFPTPNLTKVLLTAEETGHDYTLELLDASKGEHKTPEHIARHPLGKVPAIEIDGQAFFESNNIVRLIAERQNNALYANTPEARANINQWIDLFGNHIGRWLQVVFFEEEVKPALGLGDGNQAAIKEAKFFLKDQLPIFEAQLNKHSYLAGNEITIADLVAFSFFEASEYSSIDLKKYPKIESWTQSLKERPSYGKAMSHIPGNNMIKALLGRI